MGQPAPSRTSAELAGRVLDGRYRLESILGEGGLGVVWRATHLRLGKSVAVKVMRPEHLAAEGLRARFEREARSLAALTHPSIVSITDYGVEAGASGLEEPFLVMELLEGRSLDRAIADGLEPERALSIACDVLRALAYAHAEGFVHRDLKPHNVFLQAIPGGGELVRVLDFGLAKFIGDEKEEATHITRRGAVLGTPAYMAPEQATGAEVDARSDVYACAVLLFELFTGRLPFAAKGPDLLREHLLVPMPSVAATRPDLYVDPALDAFLARAGAKSPRERWQDAGAMLEAFVGLPTPTLARGDGTLPRREVTGPAKVPELATHASVPRSSDSIAQAETLVGSVNPEATVRAPMSIDPGGTLKGPGPPTPVPHTQVMPEVVAQVSRVEPLPTRGRPTPPPAKPTRRSPLGYYVSAGALLGVVAIAVASTLIFGRDDASPVAGGAPALVAAPAAPAPVTPEPPPTPATSGPRSVDPWERGGPGMLLSLHERVARGQELSEGQKRSLRAMIPRRPDDPRPLLVLAHGAFLEGARTDAMDLYERAIGVDPNAIGDPVMVHDFVVMAAHRNDRIRRRAIGLVESTFGAAALPTIDVARAELEHARDRDGVGRLEELRERLRGGAR